MSEGTTFVKKINTAPQLYKKQMGVKSYANQQYSISSGNQTLDQVVGGGFPIGSLVVLFEDTYSQYYAHFLKQYLGDGIVNEHKNIIIDPDQVRTREYWLKFLPAVIKIKEQTKEQQKQEAKPDLKVAWRYNHLIDDEFPQKDQSQDSTGLQYKFDNSKEMGQSISNSQSHQLKKDEFTIHMQFDIQNQNYIDLWENIAETIQNQLQSEEDDRIFRILLPNLNMFLPLFSSNNQEKKKQEIDFIRFLKNLKALIRSSNAVCIISVDEQLLSKYLGQNLIHLADQVIQLTSFKDNVEKQIGEYDGTLKLIKQPKLHGLISSLSEFEIYALKLKGKSGILVEKIHLEPEEDRAEQDENLQQKGANKKKQFGSTAAVMCNQTKSHQLDF